MQIRLGIALLAAIGFCGGPLLAKEALDPCGKNHYILDEPCTANWSGWSAINDGLTDLDVHVVAADPLNEATLYAGGPSGIFKSVDAGASWVHPSIPMPSPYEIHLGWNGPGPTAVIYSAIAHILIDPVNPSILYAGCDDIHALVRAADGTVFVADMDIMGDTWCPLVRTLDGAVTWDYLGYPAISALAVHPSRSNVLYAGTFDSPSYAPSEPSGVLKSVDRGVTWSTTGLTGTGVSAISLDPARLLTMYAAAAHRGAPGWPEFFNGLFKTMDGGNTWVAIGAGLEPFQGTSTVGGLVVDPDNSDVVYVALSEGGVYRSIDAGTTWAAFNEGLGSLHVHSLTLRGGRQKTLFVGTEAGVYRNTELR
jgi:hypothetical protein